MKRAVWQLVWLLVSTSSTLQALPIVSVERELYIQHTQPGVAVGSQQFMAGPGLERMEWIFDVPSSDIGSNVSLRLSSDNGRTWGPLHDYPTSGRDVQGVWMTEDTGNSMPVYDPVGGLLISPWYRSFTYNGNHNIHSYYRTSADNGLTWSTPKMFRYENGPEFDPNDPFNSNYLNTNVAYPSQKFAVTPDGRVAIGMGEANVPGSSNSLPYRYGAINFIGEWNPTTSDYDWESSNRVGLPTNLSTRGIIEPDTVQLQDGRLLVTYRGSNAGLSGAAAQAAGRKWFTVADDSGLELGPVQELKYDDGTRFYSPSSFHRTFRLERDGKLYWIGNIVPTVPNGNSPRHTLVIAEIDEALLALKKNTVTTIASQLPGELSSVQYSNFSLLENPETHQLELILTNYGALSSSSNPNVSPNLFDADAIRYTLTFNSVLEQISAGDYNGDGAVNAADYTVWRDTLGSTTNLNANGDDSGASANRIDAADYALWRSRFGNSVSQSGASNGNHAVPEPTAASLLVIALTWTALLLRPFVRNGLSKETQSRK